MNAQLVIDNTKLDATGGKTIHRRDGVTLRPPK